MSGVVSESLVTMRTVRWGSGHAEDGSEYLEPVKLILIRAALSSDFLLCKTINISYLCKGKAFVNFVKSLMPGIGAGTIVRTYQVFYNIFKLVCCQRYP